MLLHFQIVHYEEKDHIIYPRSCYPFQQNCTKFDVFIQKKKMYIYITNVFILKYYQYYAINWLII
jgi:hypothetical protein